MNSCWSIHLCLPIVNRNFISKPFMLTLPSSDTGRYWKDDFQIIYYVPYTTPQWIHLLKYLISNQFTLFIISGVFLICWLPFFSCNITDAICSKMHYNCSPGVTAFTLTTWLGYMNSVVNPIIYTIFNPEFRKAFKKIMHLET